MFTSRVHVKRTIICLLIGLALPFLSSIYRVGAATTTVYVYPPVSSVSSGDTFNINVTIADVANLTGWEFKLFYLKSVLNCSTVAEGPFLKSGGSTFKIFNITNNYNSTHGRLLAGCVLQGMNVSVNGTGVAAIVTFKALFPGSTPLDLVDTKLSDEKIPALPIPHTAIDGTVYVTGTSPDVAVTLVKPLKTIIGKSYTGDTNVTVENHGGFPATFNVTAYANTTAFASANISLTIGSSDIITLSWNTSTFAYGNYTIKAIADTVPGETDTADNTYISVMQVHVGVPGDVSGPTQGVYDNTVNMRDIQYMILLFNAKPGSTNWNPNADVNNDAVVNMRDINIAILNFNKHE